MTGLGRRVWGRVCIEAAHLDLSPYQLVILVMVVAALIVNRWWPFGSEWLMPVAFAVFVSAGLSRMRRRHDRRPEPQSCDDRLRETARILRAKGTRRGRLLAEEIERDLDRRGRT